ncbi:hypothetical protein HK099_001996, partial [Clydaea vesicula]
MSPITNIQLIQTGPNAVFNDFIIEAGWGKAVSLTGKILLTIRKPLKDAKITAIFIGTSSTKWIGNRPPESEDKKIPLTYSKNFFESFTSIRDPRILKKNKFSTELSPLKNIEDSSLIPLDIPFSIDLPASTDFPQSTKDSRASVLYNLKVVVNWQNNAFKKNFLETSCEVIMLLPDWARKKLISQDLPLSHHLPFTMGKCDVILDIPKRILSPKEYLSADVLIRSIPAGKSLRYVDVSLRSTLELKGPHGIGSIVNFTRPLSEERDIPYSQPDGKRLSITGEWKKNFKLMVDETLAKPTINSLLFSVKTVFRVEIVLDDNPIPNVVFEIPVTILSLQENNSFIFSNTEEEEGSTSATINSKTLSLDSSVASLRNLFTQKIPSRRSTFSMRSRSSSPTKTSGNRYSQNYSNDSLPSSLNEGSLYSPRNSLDYPLSPRDSSPSTPVNLYEIMEEEYFEDNLVEYNRERRPSLAEQKLDELMSEILPYRRKSVDMAYKPSFNYQELNSKFCQQKKKNSLIFLDNQLKELEEFVAENEREINEKLKRFEYHPRQSSSINAESLKKYRVVYPYQPKKNDELELKLGDIVAVKKIYPDGWALGYNLTSMMEGAVPVVNMC